MQIDTTKQALGGVTPTTSSTGDPLVNGEMGRNDFLNLLTAQMSNQDPLNPQENHEFVAQLAQFSALEQQVTTNKNLQTLALMQQSVSNGQLPSIIGKEVAFNGKVVSITDQEPQSIQVNLEQAAAEVQITISNADGNPVDVIEQTAVAKGLQEFNWDGQTSDGTQLPDGRYTISVKAIDSEGNSIVAEPISKGIVDGVTYENGFAEFIVGNKRLLPGDLISILDAPQSTTILPLTDETKARSNYSAWNR